MYLMELCADPGFTQMCKSGNMRLTVELARLMVDAGLIVLISFISLFCSEQGVE